ncbi:MAG: hypothetical protein MUO26_03305 [Methanotrichaceae archaeon]|nr:hypothetical protein [Methanotrichaceae archaeon]
MKTIFASIMIQLILLSSICAAFSSMTYTFDADFDKGTMVNINREDVPDQLQLNGKPAPFSFIWVAASTRGTVVKINTSTGKVVGEYWSAPEDRGRDPSRTTVDNNGNVWVANRKETGILKEGNTSRKAGSAVQIGLEENYQCVDRNNNGKIDTSTGLGDIKPWSNTKGADDNGGVSTAEDECVIKYIRTSATGTRTIAVDVNNNVWIGGRGNFVHELYDADTGEAIPDTRFANKCGGYGGLMDENGFLWSSGQNSACCMRYDPESKTNITVPLNYSYGMARDMNGNIWVSQFDFNKISKISPSGDILGTYPTGGERSRGVAVTPDNDIWVANSITYTVSRLGNDGTLKATIPVGWYPTGVAVDAAGKIWVTNMYSDNVNRIDPATNLVDLTINLGSDADPYNYSDMIGRYLVAPPETGTWAVVLDSGVSNAKWKNITWTADVPTGSSLAVKAASSNDGINFKRLITVSNGEELGVDPSQYLKMIVTFNRASNIKKLHKTRIGKSPVLYDLSVSTY